MKIQTNQKPIETYLYENKKFKEVVYSLQFFMDLEEQSLSKANVLLAMMRDRIQAYPTKAEVIRAKDYLYGARVGGNVRRYGQKMIIQLSITTVAERFVKTPLTDETFKFFSEMIYSPLLSEDVFKEAKKTVKARLQRRYEQPMQQAIMEGLKHFTQGTVIAQSSFGDREEIDQLRLEDIADFHQQLIASSGMAIIVGNFDSKTVSKAAEQYLRSHPQVVRSSLSFLMDPRPFETKSLSKNVTQGNLVKFYTTLTGVSEVSFTALHVLSIILGQLPTSLLFQEIREKHSLTYSIGARLQSYDGMLMIVTSLDAEKIDQTNTLIAEQFHRLEQGDFDQNLIDGALKMLQSSFDSVEDDIFSIRNFILQQYLNQASFDLDEHSQRYYQITKQDIQEVSQRVQPLGEFRLIGREQTDE